MEKSFQRIGAKSNAHAGREFEDYVQSWFANSGLLLERDFSLALGVTSITKLHRFDLGSEEHGVIVECKSHTWTAGDKVPSAKLTVWNEAMYYFSLAPKKYHKLFAVLKDDSVKRGMSLAEYYLKAYRHLIPSGVEIHEFDILQNRVKIIE